MARGSPFSLTGTVVVPSAILSDPQARRGAARDPKGPQGGAPPSTRRAARTLQALRFSVAR